MFCLSDLEDRPSYHLYVCTIPVYEFMDRRSRYKSQVSQGYQDKQKKGSPMTDKNMMLSLFSPIVV